MLSTIKHRSFLPAWVQGSEDYAARSLDPQQPVLSVMPLNSVPYSGPHLSHSSNPSPPIQNQPAMVFLPSHSSEEELERVVAATNHGVAVTGSAALGRVGRPIGSIDISESKDTYLFRVALPGVARDESKLHIRPTFLSSSFFFSISISIIASGIYYCRELCS